MMDREYILLSELIERLQKVEDKNVFVEINSEYLLKFDQPLKVEVQKKRIYYDTLQAGREIKVLQLEGDCNSWMYEVDFKAQKEKA